MSKKRHLEKSWHVVDRSSGDFGDAYIDSYEATNSTRFSYGDRSFWLYPSGEMQLVERLIRKNVDPLAAELVLSMILVTGPNSKTDFKEWIKEKISAEDLVHPDESIRALAKEYYDEADDE